MPQNDRETLDALLLAADASADHRALAIFYSRAADASEQSGDTDAACFYLTHAYVFALEQGLAKATEIHARLKIYGREE